MGSALPVDHFAVVARTQGDAVARLSAADGIVVAHQVSLIAVVADALILGKWFGRIVG